MPVAVPVPVAIDSNSNSFNSSNSSSSNPSYQRNRVSVHRSNDGQIVIDLSLECAAEVSVITRAASFWERESAKVSKSI